MAEDENPPVVFRVRAGKDAYTCRGHLVREGGLVYAIGEDAENGMFAPDRVRLEESDLELRRDADGRAWYQYHGWVYLAGGGF